MWRKWPAALRVSLLYGVFGCLWIVLSDWIVAWVARNPDEIQFLQTFKGIIFVLLSMLVVFFLSYFETQKRRDIEGEAQYLQSILGKAMRTAGAAAFVYNHKTRQLTTSDGFAHLLGGIAQQTRIDWEEWITLVHPKDREPLNDALNASVEKGERLDMTIRVKDGEGRLFTLHLQGARAARTGRDKDRLIGSMTDISAVKEAEEEALRTASLLEALLHVNHEVMVAKSEAALFDNVCKALTKEDRVHLAWVNLCFALDAGDVSVVTIHGDEAVKAAVDNDPDQQKQADALAERAIRSGTIQVAEPVCASAQAGRQKRPPIITSIIAVPIHSGGDVVGVLNVYGELPVKFDEPARAVLMHVGDDIGFALHNLRRQDRLTAAEENSATLGRQLEETLIGAVKALSLTVELRDPYTAGHQERVAELAVAIAREMGLPNQKVQDIRLGSLMHDLGKIRVPAEILTRPGRLSPEEFEMIKPHPLHGVEIARHVGLPETVINVIGQHHERLDGKGYPKGLSGTDISTEARIVAVADAVEAMSSHRPYRAALGVPKALELIGKEAGISLDEHVVEACTKVFKKKGFKFSSSFGLETA